MSADDLIAFLRAQLAEDERVALAAPGPDWVLGTERAGEPGRWRGVKADLVMLPPAGPFAMDLDVGAEVLRAEFVNDGNFSGRRTVDHAARWDPARVLAQVRVHRRILDLLAAATEQVRNPVSAKGRSEAERAKRELECVARLLAQPYAGQPGWRDEWSTQEP